MTYSQLKYFIEVARCGSFTYAAERLFITTPSLSKYIGSLEEELGFKLFIRKSRGVELTEEGYKFYHYIEQPFQNLNAVYSHAISNIKEKQHSIVIACSDDECIPPQLTDLFFRFNRVHKGKNRILLRTCPLNELYKGLLDRSFDLILANEIYVRTIMNISYYTLETAYMSLAMRRDHPLANRESLDIPDLTEDCLIATIPKNGFDNIESPTSGLASFAAGILTVDSLQEALLNVAAGNGIAIVPSNTIDIDDPVIKKLPLPVRINESHYCVAWCTDEPDPLVLELADQIRDTICKQDQ